MSKMPIDWHRECFKNASESQARRIRERDRLTLEIERNESELLHYARQIEEAEKRKLDAFDSERLLVKRGKRDHG